MTETKVGNYTIKPLDKNVKEIHPAIGIIDDSAYVGVWIPCEITGPKNKVAFKDLLWLITSRKQQILANDEQLRNFGWRLSYRPIRFRNRWALNHVKAFMTSEATAPAPETVLTHIVSAYREHIEFSDGKEYVYHALWDIGTYFHHLFNAYPYLYIGGTKRCGKTKTLILHSLLALNAFFSNNMSISSIYRLIQNARGTLLIDETEKLSSYRMSERTLEFRSILLAGYKKGGKCYRVEKGRGEILRPQEFEVYAPKALANISGLEDILEDRCKTTILRRSRNKAIINNEPDVNDPKWSELRNELYIFYLTFWSEIQTLYNELGELSELVNVETTTHFSDEDLAYITGRELELWKSIFALARFFDKKQCAVSKFTSSLNSPASLTGMMLKLAVEDAKQRQVENITETGEAILVQVLQKIVNADGYYKIKSIKETMGKEFDEEQKWITTKWIGNALRRLGFKEKRRVGTGYEYKLKKEDVKELAERMQIPKAVLVHENFQLVLKTLKEECKDKPYAALEDLVKITGLDKDDLKAILGEMQREGKATQTHPDMWQPETLDTRDIRDMKKSEGVTEKCERCGKPATHVLTREDGVHHFCDSCMENWEGNL
jgi:hypothetical protein